MEATPYVNIKWMAMAGLTPDPPLAKKVRIVIERIDKNRNRKNRQVIK